MQQPTLSVIIPSFRGGVRLPRLLAEINRQALPGDEVIVVDDGSPDETSAVAAQYSSRVVRLANNGGAGRARNEGARAAGNDVLVFFDDDVVPLDGYLSRVRTLFASQETVCAQGPHEMLPLNDNPDIWQRADALIWRHYMASQCVCRGFATTCYSGAFAIRRNAFLSLGGFSEAFSGAGGEEFEFSLRISARHAIVYDPQLGSFHRFKGFGKRIATLFRRAQNYPAVASDSSGRRMPIFTGETLRLAVAGVLVPVAVTAIWKGSMSLILFGALLVAFLMVDRGLYVDLWRWRKLGLAPTIMFYRLVQYWTIGAGIVTRVVGR